MNVTITDLFGNKRTYAADKVKVTRLIIAVNDQVVAERGMGVQEMEVTE